jgi:hypothetical protein
MKAMHEQFKALRPTSARARALLDPQSVRPRVGRNGGVGSATREKPRVAEPFTSAHAVVISPAALRLHSSDVFRGVLPPLHVNSEAALHGSSLSLSAAASAEPSGLSEFSRMSEGSAMSSAERSEPYHAARLWHPNRSTPWLHAAP